MGRRARFDPCRVTAFQHVLLYLLCDCPMSGVALARAADGELRADVPDSRVYHNLSRLVEEGFVERRNEDGRTNRYAITSRGSEWLRDRRRWEYRLSKRSW
jgi:DNA-binding PadR family transcriptional regulator